MSDLTCRPHSVSFSVKLREKKIFGLCVGDWFKSCGFLKISSKVVVPCNECP
jgi:hypothetical protein